MWMWFCILILFPCALCVNKDCPGGSMSCPDTATCCQLADSSYGCCPLKNAVCCDDHIHCCPSNTKCDAGICIELQGANMTAKRLDNEVTCSDSKFSCPKNSMCCKGTLSGSYGCCPLPNGVCCGDDLHCCPENTVCNLEKQKCVGSGFVSEMYDSQKNKISKLSSTNFLSILKPGNISNVVCTGGFQCPDKYTCCQLPDGTWGCCPFPKATCCPDKVHCCPQDMKCDPSSTSCFRGPVSIPSMQKEIAKPLDIDLITCPDNSTCADSETCCKTGPAKFGCCPYEDAVCCKDLSHCCPTASVCDLIEKRCVFQSKSVLYV